MKFFKHLHTAALCVAIAASVSSCVNNWLDQFPADGIDADTAIKNSEDLANARTGLYAALKGSSSLVDYYGRLMWVYGDVRGEDVQYEYNSGSGRAEFYYYMNYSTADDFKSSSAIWQTPYIVIARANRVIEAAESGQLSDAAAAQAAIAQYAAEAKVIRAMSLFDLTRVYGKPYTMDNGASLGVPIVTSPIEASEKPARNTVAECYTTIENDLSNAIDSHALLQSNEESAGYVNEWTAKALQVRVYMTKGEWDKALTVAEDIIEHSPYSLWNTSEYASAWSESNAAHSKEVLLEMIINDNTDWTDREGIAYLYADNKGVSPGYGDVIVTKKFSDMLTSDPQDVRNSILVESGNTDPSLPFKGVKVYINKLPAVNGDVRYANIPLLRLSEVYLSAAEAAFQNGNKPKAVTYLNDIIRNRTTDASKLVDESNITLDRIYIERRKELVGEGQRFFDAMRRGETITRYTSSADQGWHDILTEDARSISRESKKALPLIPSSEINANPNIKQNPAY